MVAVEDASCPVQVEVILGVLVPRQRHKRLQIRHLHVVVGALWVEVVEFREFLFEDLLCLLRPLPCPRLLHEFLALRTAVLVAKLFLDVLYLLVQEIVALLCVEVLMSLHADLLHQSEKLVLAVQYLQKLKETSFDTVQVEQPCLVLKA